MINVLITDDHPIVRQGIRQILEDDHDQRFGIIAEASGAKELLENLAKGKFNVVTLDISLPGRSGLELIPEIRKISPATAVLILSIFPEEQYAVRALKLGASGYLTKSSAPQDLISAILKISEGGKFITPSLAEKLTLDMLNDYEKPLHESLSAREMEVIRLIASGLSINEIGEKLSLSPKTISTYKDRILLKLKMKSTAALIRYALDNNLTEKI
jgi:two-component system, NarL family, invasion response regulator UvrY